MGNVIKFRYIYEAVSFFIFFRDETAQAVEPNAVIFLFFCSVSAAVQILHYSIIDNGNAMFQSYLSKLLIKKETGPRYARTAAMGNTGKKCSFF